MKLVSRLRKEVVVALTYEELLILNSALNETCNGLAMVGFESRVGAPRADVEQLLASVGELIDSASV
jgi:hypothetical protein